MSKYEKTDLFNAVVMEDMPAWQCLPYLLILLRGFQAKHAVGVNVHYNFGRF